VRVIAVAIAFGAGACSFLANYGDTHYRCDPTAPDCPMGERCSRDGFCEAAGVGGGSDGSGGSGSDDTPDASTSTAAPDAQIAPAPPDAPPVATFVRTFGERSNTDFANVTTDTYVEQDQAATNFGSDDNASFDASPLTNSLLRFDVTGAAGHTVVKAELVVYLFDPLEDGDCVLSPIIEGWSEHKANWALRDSTNPWTTLGGTAGPEAARFTPSTTGEWTVDLPPSLVQGWIAAPGTNHGVLFTSTSTNGRGGQWYTHESNNTDQRPLLRLTLE
jgi:hypothetical protein